MKPRMGWYLCPWDMGPNTRCIALPYHRKVICISWNPTYYPTIIMALKGSPHLPPCCFPPQIFDDPPHFLLDNQQFLLPSLHMGPCLGPLDTHAIVELIIAYLSCWRTCSSGAWYKPNPWQWVAAIGHGCILQVFSWTTDVTVLKLLQMSRPNPFGSRTHNMCQAAWYSSAACLVLLSKCLYNVSIFIFGQFPIPKALSCWTATALESCDAGIGWR